ncbi:MAG TPA: ScpA family protein [Xanthomonadales bacterium]|nr:ScpA family protein [Xanthomonadales bacterium]
MTEAPPLPKVENASARQAEIPFAVVRGEPFYELPKDLYIPPDALEVILEAFEGPLDLLLYLIRRQNLDILDIPIAAITKQYIGYIEMMQELRFELAAEYLVMAAILAEIKSRLLLPRPPVNPDEEADPRAELVRRLQEYERFKKAAEDIEALPRMERDTCAVSVHVPERKIAVVPPEVELRELLLAFRDVLNRADLFVNHQIRREPLSVRQKMIEVLDALSSGEFCEFSTLFVPAEGRLGVVVSFLALLELGKAGLIEIVQDRPLAPIYLKSLALREPDA